MDFNELWKSIFAAMMEPLEAAWLKAKSFAETESKKLAHSLVTITRLHLLPTDHPEHVNKKQAKLLVDIQIAASRGILLTIEALGLIAVQKAIVAGLNAVKTTINGKIGFALI